jgi:two-component system OmpR family response regulator
MRLLVVEDDPQISEGLSRGLRRAGHAVDSLIDGASAIHELATHDYDLMILDLGLPGMDGYAVLRELRNAPRPTPTLVLTARDELDDRIRGLDLGADDYMVKPFEMAELEARIRAITRRVHGIGGSGEIAIGKLRFRIEERRFFLGDTALELSPREYNVLEILLLRQGRVVSKAQIQHHLCTWHQDLSDGAIEVYVHRVRRKIESGGVEIRTIRGFGYLLQAGTAEESVAAEQPQPLKLIPD